MRSIRNSTRRFCGQQLLSSAGVHIGSLEAAADEVAAALDSADDPMLLVALFSALGTPSGPDVSAVKDPAEAAALGAAEAGAPAPDITRRKGSRKRQIQGAVQAALGVGGAPSSLSVQASNVSTYLVKLIVYIGLRNKSERLYFLNRPSIIMPLLFPTSF